MGRGTPWLNAGTHESLLQASMVVQARQDRQGLMISCPEGISWRMGLVSAMKGNVYGQHLMGLEPTLTRNS